MINWTGKKVWTFLITNGWSSRGKKGEVMCNKSSYSNVHYTVPWFTFSPLWLLQAVLGWQAAFIMIDSGVKVTWRWSFVMRGWGHQVNDSGIGQLQGDSQLLWPVRTISTNNNWQRKKHVAWKITFYRGEILFHIEFSCKFIKIYFFVKVGWVHTEHNEGVLGGFKRNN